MQDEAFLASQQHQKQQWRAVREGAHPDILEFERLLIKALRVRKVPMFAHSIVRGENEQNAAFAHGNSKARYGQSPHNFGCAVDIVHGRVAWALSKKQWDIIGHLGKSVAKSHNLKVTWGGDFKSLYDPAHWELTQWKTLKDDFPWLTQK